MVKIKVISRDYSFFHRREKRIWRFDRFEIFLSIIIRKIILRIFYNSFLVSLKYFNFPILSPLCLSEDEEDFDVEEEDNMYVPRMSQPDPSIDTSRVEEIPAKEPKFHAVPLKSVLKKRGSGSGPGTPQNTPTQENRPLTLRQELHASFKLVRDQTTDFFDEPRPTFFRASRLFFSKDSMEGGRGGGNKRKRNLNFNRNRKAVRKKL